MNSDKFFIVSEHVVTRTLGSELVLLDLSGGTYFGLDQIGALVWEHLAAGKNIAGAAELVCGRFDVDMATAEADINALVEQLRDAGLLK